MMLVVAFPPSFLPVGAHPRSSVLQLRCTKTQLATFLRPIHFSGKVVHGHSPALQIDSTISKRSRKPNTSRNKTNKKWRLSSLPLISTPPVRRQCREPNPQATDLRFNAVTSLSPVHRIPTTAIIVHLYFPYVPRTAAAAPSQWRCCRPPRWWRC